MSEMATFKYSAVDGTLELVGSEEFVSKHFDSMSDLIRLVSRHIALEQKNIQSESNNCGEAPTSQPTGEAKEVGIGAYPEHYEEINGKLKVTCDIPGSNQKQMMTNAAILYCFGSTLMGDEQVSSKDIREACESHGILDSGNFSKVFDDQKLFVTDGVKGGTKNVKLTHQGKKRAQELLNE